MLNRMAAAIAAKKIKNVRVERPTTTMLAIHHRYTPACAIILAILGIVFFLLGLLFLLVKSKRVTGNGDSHRSTTSSPRSGTVGSSVAKTPVGRRRFGGSVELRKKDVDQISPELALVDAELGRDARASLLNPGECLRPRTPEALRVVAFSPEPPTREPQPAVAVSVAGATARASAEPSRVLVERKSAPSGPRVERRRPVKGARRHLGLVAIGVSILALSLLAFVPPDDSMAPQLVGERQPDEASQPPHRGSPEAKQAGDRTSSAATPSDGRPASSKPRGGMTSNGSAPPKAKRSAATTPPATARRAARPKRPATAQTREKPQQTPRKSPRALPAVGASNATGVAVTAGKPAEFKFTLSKKSVANGTVTFTVTNRGKLRHDFKIAGEKTVKLKRGEATALNVVLRAGRAAYRCTLPGHATRGMKGTLTVK